MLASLQVHGATGRARGRPVVSCLLLLSVLLFIPGCDLFGDDDSPYRMGQLIWSRDLADPSLIDITQPVIDGDVVYVAAGGELLSLALADGTLRWKRPLAGLPYFSENMLHDAEALYFANAGNIEAYNKHDGTLRWRMSGGPSIPRFSVLTETETHIYPGRTDGVVVRVRKRDGQVDQEIYLADLQPEDDDNGQRPGAPMPSDDGYLYVPTSYYVPGAPAIGGNVLAYDAATGDYRWGYEVPTRQTPVPGYPGSYWTRDAGAEEGVVWESSVIVQAGTSVLALDRFSGALRWQQLFEDEAGFWLGMALAYGRVYVATVDVGTVYALDPETGEILWTSPPLDGSVITLLEVEEERIYLDTTKGKIAILDANTGALLWQGPPPDHESSKRSGRDIIAAFLSPVAAENGYMVNVGSYSIYCLGAR